MNEDLKPYIAKLKQMYAMGITSSTYENKAINFDNRAGLEARILYLERLTGAKKMRGKAIRLIPRVNR